MKRGELPIPQSKMWYRTPDDPLVLLPTDHPHWTAFVKWVQRWGSGVNKDVVVSAREFTNHGQQLWAAFVAGVAAAGVLDDAAIQHAKLNYAYVG